MRLEPSLLAKIVANPDDPAPRLACAEWLEQQVSARAG